MQRSATELKATMAEVDKLTATLAFARGIPSDSIELK